MKRTFKYCTVVPKFRENDFFYYLDYSEKVKKGTCVIAPFGNDEIIGRVSKVEYFDEDNVPFSLNKMKSINRIISKEDYDNYSIADYLGADESDWYELEVGDKVEVKEPGVPVGVVVDKTWSDYCHDYEYKVKSAFDSDYWGLQCYSCYELEKYEVLGKVRYIGKDISFDLYNNHIYDVISVQDINGFIWIRVIDGSGSSYMYSWENPCDLMNPDICGKWKIVEDINRKLSCALKYPKSFKPDNGDNGPYDYLVWISYENFKKIYESINVEPEFCVYLENKATEEYLIIKYKDGPTFQKCGLKNRSEAIKFKNLDELYKSKTIDEICLKRDWDKVRICPNGYESIEEFCFVYDIKLNI